MRLPIPVLLLSMLLSAGSQLYASSPEAREEIPPLTKSEWGQQAPFFYATPPTDGAHCKTGCVATAMSQLIYYHRYPYRGKPDTYTYMTGAHGNLSFNFAENAFDYTLMQDVYDRATPPEDISAQEVSKLMFAAGVTVNMSYGLTESAGQFSGVSNSFREWFLYPEDGVKQVSREYFTHEEWEDLVYDELANKRPVIYMGGNGTSSHVFLCDGYKDGLFHMNWGWYGECNGYFSLVDLQTYVPSQGKVWSLNSSQGIVRGIHAPGDPTPAPLATALSFEYADDLFTLTSANISASKKSVIMGIKVVDADGNEQFMWDDGQTELSRSSKSISFGLGSLPLADGTYIFRPVFKLADDNTETYYNVYCNLTNNRFLTVTLANREIVSAVGGTDAEVSVSISDFKPNSPLIYGEVLNRSFTVFAENNGNINITRIKQWFYEPGTDTRVDAYENGYPVALTVGSSQTITLALPSNLPPGQYEMQLIDGNNNLLGGRIPFTYYDNRNAVRIGDSPFRFLALDAPASSLQSLTNQSEALGEAIMLKPTGSVFTAPASLVIPETVEISGKTYRVIEIGPQLAMNHTEISSVTIPASVRNIAAGAFNGCTEISEITVKATTPPAIAPTSFADAIKPTAKVTVPAGTLTAYLSDPQWSRFENLVEVEVESKNGLSMGDFEIEQGAKAQAALILNSDVPYYGFQFNIELPEGLSLTEIENCEILQDFTTNFGAINDNSCRIIGFDINGAEIPAGSHEILILTFEAAKSFVGGTVRIYNIKFSADNGDQTHKDLDFDEVEITVSPIQGGSSGIEDSIYTINDAPVEVFNLSGIKVAAAASIDELNLPAGIYIVRIGTEYRKILIR